VRARVQAQSVGVRFLFGRDRRLLTPTLARIRRRGGEAWGVKDVDFEIGPGEKVGLVGPSGSGKTTILRLIAGVLVPDEGELEVRGRVGALLSIEAGLLPSLTGRENALLLGVLAGLPRKEARLRIEEVKELSGLGEQFERPTSSFSQGMRARLGFAVAAQIQPQILLLDEVHEALDHEYRGVLERRAEEISSSGGIVIVSGHDHELLSRFCDRGIFLRKGRIEADSSFRGALHTYLAH
jgi:ABC-type polysaccharide/polyol phosphate transport system ATPase subunit